MNKTINWLIATFILLLAGSITACRSNSQSGGNSQVLEIYDVKGSKAKAKLIIDGEVLFTTDVFIGKNGLGKQREGDLKTPVGKMSVKGAFGICDNPGTTIPYTHVTPSIFSCSDSAYYNQVIYTAAVHHLNCTGEDMFHIVPEYNYGLMTSYNEECRIGLGNSIFVHCKGKKLYTGGCIALDEDKMIEVLTRCDSTLLINVKP